MTNIISRQRTKHDNPQPHSVKRVADVFVNVALVGASLILLLVAITRAFPNPLYAPQSVFRFGAVPEGTEVRAHFWVRNIYPHPLTVSRLEGGCGCTKAFTGKNTPFVLQPFEAVEVNALYDTASRQGAVNQAVRVFTDKNEVAAVLTIAGNVIPASPAPSRPPKGGF